MTTVTESQLSNLLAVIHRDGGHYEQDFGTLKAAKAAEQIVINLRSRCEGLIESNRELFETIGLLRAEIEILRAELEQLKPSASP